MCGDGDEEENETDRSDPWREIRSGLLDGKDGFEDVK